MKSTFLIILIASLCMACTSEPTVPNDEITITGRNSNFLVKLTSSMSTESNEPGDAVRGVVIDPVPLRGGRVEGTIDRADRSFLDFSFNTLRFEGKTYHLKSTVTSIVNSKGNAGQDDLGQRVRMARSGIIAYGTTTAIDEGAEIRFLAWEE